jgi:hypothetical protein
MIFCGRVHWGPTTFIGFIEFSRSYTRFESQLFVIYEHSEWITPEEC